MSIFENKESIDKSQNYSFGSPIYSHNFESPNNTPLKDTIIKIKPQPFKIINNGNKQLKASD